MLFGLPEKNKVFSQTALSADNDCGTQIIPNPPSIKSEETFVFSDVLRLGARCEGKKKGATALTADATPAGESCARGKGEERGITSTFR